MNLPEIFLLGMNFVFEQEGGTNTSVYDRGGITKYGISSKTYPNLDILNLTKEQALEIYLDDYWMTLRCGYFQTPVAIVMLDSGINCGQPTAAKWLQIAINGNHNFLKVDGIIGPQTMLASEGYPSYKLAGRIVALRVKHYSDLIRKYPDQVANIKGWNNRAGDLLLFI